MIPGNGMFSSRYKNKNPQGSNPGDPSDGERNTAQQHSRTKSPSIAVAPGVGQTPLKLAISYARSTSGRNPRRFSIPPLSAR